MCILGVKGVNKGPVSCALSHGVGANPAELRDTHSWRPSQIKSTLLVHPIKMGFHIPITIKSNMNNRNSI